MSYLVDTDIVSAHLRGSGIVTNRFFQYSGRLHLSVVTLAELKVWVLRKQTAVRFRQAHFFRISPL
jgi:predicted nucleic acid-binding protein